MGNAQRRRKFSDVTHQPPLLVLDMSDTSNEYGALVGLVIEALKNLGWACVAPSDVAVEDKSGFGGSKCYRVSANATPPVVALHSLQGVGGGLDISDFHGRLGAAAQVFSDGGCGPRRLAQGTDWFIEVWEGSGDLDWSPSLDQFRELGELLAAVHRLPTVWYDVWREKACEREPALRHVSHRSHVWWYACKYWDCNEALPSSREHAQALQFWIKEEQCFSPARGNCLYDRLVTSHGDCHPGNIIQTEAGLKLLDFEYTAVRSALFDVAFVFMWAGRAENKRVFLKQYLDSSSLPSDDDTLDRLSFDAAIYVAATHVGPLWPKVRSWDMEEAAQQEDLIFAVRKDPLGIHDIMTLDVGSALRSYKAMRKAEQGRDFRNFSALAKQEMTAGCKADFVDQCWFVRAHDGSRFLQVNLSSVGRFARFNLQARFLCQGTFTLSADASGDCCYGERLQQREGIFEHRQAEIDGDAQGFCLVIVGDTYMPVSEHAFPWAMALARVELQRDVVVCLENYEDLCFGCADCDQLFCITKHGGERYFQYNFGASKEFVFINAEADSVLDTNRFTMVSGAYFEPAWPRMKTEVVLVEDKVKDKGKFCFVFDGQPHGRHEFIPLAWDFIDWASESVVQEVRRRERGERRDEATSDVASLR